MAYYNGNGVYDYLAQHEEGRDFFWTGKDIWILVYGNADCEPMVLTVASANRPDAAFTNEEKNAVDMAAWLAGESGISVNFVRFDPARPMDQVGYCEPGMKKVSVISSDALRGHFSKYGLKMNDMGAGKMINDRSSSPYHEWQRTYMGNSVVVSDIDLLQLRNHLPVKIIELKRSYITLDRWTPYTDDYDNFILLSRLAVKSNMEFLIVYNRRIKNPFLDDISRLKFFRFDHREDPYCRFLGYGTIQELARQGV